MSKAINYVQCQLKRNNSIQVSFIPEKFAKVGKYIKIKNRETGEWINGWRVEETWSKITAKEAEKQERYYLTQREGSDI